MQVTANKQCRAPKTFPASQVSTTGEDLLFTTAPSQVPSIHWTSWWSRDFMQTKLWRVRRHQYVREISSCSSYQHEYTTLFLAWTIYVVMCPMSIVAQQNRKSLWPFPAKSGLLSPVLWGRESSAIAGGECFPFFLGCFMKDVLPALNFPFSPQIITAFTDGSASALFSPSSNAWRTGKLK